jgi:DNA-binding protein YbaB
VSDEVRGDATINRLVTEAREKAARYEEMRTEVEQVSVTESSPDELVTVTVDSGGVVTDLRITDKVAEHSGTEVAAAVLATMRRAQAKIADRVTQVVRDLVGDDEALLDKVSTSYHSRFPDPEPEESLDPDELEIGRMEDE